MKIDHELEVQVLGEEITLMTNSAMVSRVNTVPSSPPPTDHMIQQSTVLTSLKAENAELKQKLAVKEQLIDTLESKSKEV